MFKARDVSENRRKKKHFLGLAIITIWAIDLTASAYQRDRLYIEIHVGSNPLGQKIASRVPREGYFVPDSRISSDDLKQNCSF
jgi:hypothetical protein